MPKSPEMRVFLLHLAAYLVVNAILIVLNLMQTVPEGQTRDYWFQWPLIGWGIGVAAHGLALFLRHIAKPGSRLDDERVRGFCVHLFVYVAVNILLIAVDLVTTPGAQWFWWPLLGWGAGLAAHGFGVWRATRGGPEASSPTQPHPDLETESPWPESSVTESPKTGETPPSPAPPASEASRPAAAPTPKAETPKRAPAKRTTPRKPRGPRKKPPQTGEPS